MRTDARASRRGNVGPHLLGPRREAPDRFVERTGGDNRDGETEQPGREVGGHRDARGGGAGEGCGQHRGGGAGSSPVATGSPASPGAIPMRTATRATGNAAQTQRDAGRVIVVEATTARSVRMRIAREPSTASS